MKNFFKKVRREEKVRSKFARLFGGGMSSSRVKRVSGKRFKF